MQSILEELFYRNIRPELRRYNDNPSFVKADKLKQRNYEKLLAALGEPEKELLEKYMDAQEELENKVHYDTFTYAMKFGVLLMSEVFVGMSQVSKEVI